MSRGFDHGEGETSNVEMQVKMRQYSCSVETGEQAAPATIARYDHFTTFNPRGQ